MTNISLGALVLPSAWNYMLDPRILEMRFRVPESADCLKCPEVAEGRRHPVAKCCQYMPSVPCFAVGEALSENSNPEADFFRGVMGTPRAKPLYLAIPPPPRNEPEGDPLLSRIWGPESLPGWFVCPLLKDGMCTSYDHRSHVCASYVCPSSGRTDEQRWHTIRTLLDITENTACRLLASACFKGHVDAYYYIATWKHLGERGVRFLDDIRAERRREMFGEVGGADRREILGHLQEKPIFNSRNPFSIEDLTDLVLMFPE